MLLQEFASSVQSWGGSLLPLSDPEGRHGFQRAACASLPVWLDRWVWAHSALGQRSFCRHRIHGLPCPVQTFPFIVIEQTLSPQLFKDARISPLLKASMRITTRIDPCSIKCFPLAPCSQRVKNGIHRILG